MPFIFINDIMKTLFSISLLFIYIGYVMGQIFNIQHMNILAHNITEQINNMVKHFWKFFSFVLFRFFIPVHFFKTSIFPYPHQREADINLC